MAIKITRLRPVFSSILIFIVAQALTFLTAARINGFLRVNRIYVPPQEPEAITFWPPAVSPPPPPGETPAPAVGSLGPILIYFFAVVVVMGLVLFLVPFSALRKILRLLFVFLFTWGAFIMLILWLPPIPTLVISVAIGFIWFFVPRVWFHDLVMVLAMVSLGAVFGRLITPWTAMVLILVLAVYDFLAVRLGYMVWMTKKLSQSVTLPAFVLPRRNSEWNSSLKESGVTNLVEEDPAARKYSVLGGGDIGFPLLLTASTYFAYSLNAALLVAGFSLIGLIGAYWIQAVFLKGKPMPALPPIAFFTLIALLIVRFV